MAKEDAVIGMYGTASQDNSASIDVPDDGVLMAIDMFIDGILNAADEGVIASVEFGSVNTRTTNDTRSLLAIVQQRVTLVTSGVGSEVGSSHIEFPTGIKVFGGERIYLHTGVLGTGVFTNCRALLTFNFSTFVARRR